MHRLNSKNIFLLDGGGALVSALFLGVILPAVQAQVGMPLWVLYTFSAMASVLATYSLSCYSFVDHSKPIWLRVVITGNLTYCLLSLTAVVVYFSRLTTLGLLYFLAEKGIVLGLVGLEYRLMKGLPTSQ